MEQCYPNALTIAVIIPTRNRAESLRGAVRSVLGQTTRPAALIIVDQSESTKPRSFVEEEYSAAGSEVQAGTALVYISDPKITGLSEARNAGLSRAKTDLILYLDDDVELAPDFIAELLNGFRADAGLTAMSGVIANYVQPAWPLRAWLRVFARGVFHDDRQPVYWAATEGRRGPCVPARRLGGGLLAVWTATASRVGFDQSLRGVCDGEDVDFCVRLGPQARLAINPRARLMHYHDPSGRAKGHWLARYLRGELYLYRKHWKHGIYNRLCYAWMLCGCGVVLGLASLRRRSLEPWRAVGAIMRDITGALPGEDRRIVRGR